MRPALPTGHAVRRAGFTALELMIAVAVSLILIGLAAPIFNAQTGAVRGTAGRSDVMRTAAFAVDVIDQELRNAGVGAYDGQPVLVRGATDAITFNANLVTARTNDPVAVFYDPDADSASVAALTTSTTVTLPNSSVTYPLASYNSNAETISYYAVADTATSPVNNTTTYTLRRRVNRGAEEIIARNLIRGSKDAIFRYFGRTSTGALVEFSGNQLPLYHSTARHGTPADTAGSARMDSVSLVRVTFISAYTSPRGAVSVDTVTRNVRISNQGLLTIAQCGDAPIAPGIPSLALTLLGTRNVPRVTFSISADELSGERDVEQYAVYRRNSGQIDWGEPIATIPAGGLSTLTYIDDTVVSGRTYEYSVTALDCTPAPSVRTGVAAISVP